MVLHNQICFVLLVNNKIQTKSYHKILKSKNSFKSGRLNVLHGYLIVVLKEISCIFANRDTPIKL
jgi:hypothetical protein